MITLDHSAKLIPYQEALQRQEDLQAQKIAEPLTPDTLLLLQHTPVYTIGRTRDHSSLSPLPSHFLSSASIPVVEIHRGGQATYHGPGQLVGYPIIDLRHYVCDLHKYIAALELALISTCTTLGITAHQRQGLTGVWVQDRKLASIGVGVKKWVTLHGFAINITPESLSGFTHITPCGIAGVQMTCLANEIARAGVTPPSDLLCQFAALIPAHLQATLTYSVVGKGVDVDVDKV